MPKVMEFENAVAEYVGATYAIATVNGTSALHAAIDGLNIRAGEVLSQALVCSYM